MNHCESPFIILVDMNTCFLPASSELCIVGFMCGIILPEKHPDIQSGIGPHEPGMRLFELCNHPAEIGGGVASESDRGKTWGMCVITWLSQTQNNTSATLYSYRVIILSGSVLPS